MTERYKDKPTLQWQQMNVCALDFPDETFDDNFELIISTCQFTKLKNSHTMDRLIQF